MMNGNLVECDLQVDTDSRKKVKRRQTKTTPVSEISNCWHETYRQAQTSCLKSAKRSYFMIRAATWHALACGLMCPLSPNLDSVTLHSSIETVKFLIEIIG